MSHLKKLIRSGSIPIHFIRCKDKYGRDAYFFLLAAPAKINRLGYQKNGIIDLKEYGDILASGLGRTPPKQLVEQLEAKYHVVLSTLVDG